MVIRLRNATIDDAEGIGRVYVETWQRTYADILPASYLERLTVNRLTQSWRRQLRTEQMILVAEHEGDIVGFSSGGRESNNDPFFRGEIFTLYVLPSHQRIGIGAQLLIEMLKLLESPLLVWVLARNEGAARFYESLGGVAVRYGTHTVAKTLVDKVAYAYFDVG